MDTFGARLRAAREQRGISLRDLAAQTKISASVLEALERNDVSRLPGGIFGRGFVRAYALEVGLDPELTVHEFLDCCEEYSRQTNVTTLPRAFEEDSRFEGQQRIARVLLKGALVSIPLIAVVLYFTLRAPTGPAAPGEAIPDPAVIELPAASPAATQAPAVQVTSTPGTPTSSDGSMTLVMHPTGACWVHVTVDGRPVWSRLLRPGDTERLQVHESVVIQVGDAGAFAFSIDGREGRPLGAAGDVRTVRITKETMNAFLR